MSVPGRVRLSCCSGGRRWPIPMCARPEARPPYRHTIWSGGTAAARNLRWTADSTYLPTGGYTWRSCWMLPVEGVGDGRPHAHRAEAGRVGGRSGTTDLRPAWSITAIKGCGSGLRSRRNTFPLRGRCGAGGNAQAGWRGQLGCGPRHGRGGAVVPVRRSAHRRCWRRRAGQACPFSVGGGRLGACGRAFLAHDQPLPVRPGKTAFPGRMSPVTGSPGCGRGRRTQVGAVSCVSEWAITSIPSGGTVACPPAAKAQSARGRRRGRKVAGSSRLCSSATPRPPGGARSARSVPRASNTGRILLEARRSPSRLTAVVQAVLILHCQAG